MLLLRVILRLLKSGASTFDMLSDNTCRKARQSRRDSCRSCWSAQESYRRVQRTCVTRFAVLQSASARERNCKQTSVYIHRVAEVDSPLAARGRPPSIGCLPAGPNRQKGFSRGPIRDATPPSSATHHIFFLSEI